MLPAKRFGPLVCVALIEASPHPKARLLACKECYDCVEKIGLSGIGKRGVLAAAKALSDEKLQDNRNALVDLMVLLVSRMNGDVQRFLRICGSSLTAKARSLIEEQLQKGGGTQSSSGTRTITSLPSPRRDGQPRRSTNLPQPGKATPSRLPSIQSKPQSASLRSYDTDTGNDAGFQDELPALDLRCTTRTTPTSIPRVGIGEYPSVISSSPPIKRPSCSVSDGHLNQILGTNKADDTTPSDEDKESIKSSLFSATSNDTMDSNECDAFGAAASLRARLMKIRERNKTGTGQILETKSVDDTSTRSSRGDETKSSVRDAIDDTESEDIVGAGFSQLPECVHEAKMFKPTKVLDEYLEKLRHLLSRSVPLSEEDDEIMEGTDVLKSLHAAVSQQPGLAVNLDPGNVVNLRGEIKGKANEVVETLTRYDFVASLRTNAPHSLTTCL